MADDRVLILGGAGYFGSRLTEALAENRKLVVTYRKNHCARSAWLEKQPITGVQWDSFVHPEPDFAGNFDIIINLAMPGALEANRDPERASAAALVTIDLCLKMIERGEAQRLIHFSTFHVYGLSASPIFRESQIPAPVHPYGETHLVVEQRILDHSAVDKATILRATNLVGAPAHADLGDQSKLLFLDLCRQAADGEMHLTNDGKSYRDFLGFRDAITAVLLLMTGPLPTDRLLNLATGRSTRLDSLAEMIAAAAPTPVPITYGQRSDSFREPFAVDTSRLQALGWAPAENLSTEIAEGVEFFR